MQQIKVPFTLVGHPANTANQADFVWSACDPAAIRVTFYGDGGGVEWVFGRELLADGISSIVPVGFCDVKIASAVADVVTQALRFKIMLSSPEGEATVIMESGSVMDFLQLTESTLATAIFEGSAEEKAIMHELDYAIESILAQAEGGQA